MSYLKVLEIRLLYSIHTLKLSHCDLKDESLVELKFDKGFRVIGEYLSQIHSQYRGN